MTTLVVLVLIALGLFGYAVYTKYEANVTGEPSVPKRIWVAITGAIVAVGAAIAILFKQG